ncbi:hypothetical protein KNO15_10930 [Leifsonia shinshuensis]|uniref:hypothetical protein n=1 Tax=Leifsonia shinshuensis TaxID=150026 RepID=UPI001F512A66|nr:hypothetical protein [Leifsonia shinshuensis]MCI0157208.1 hypothetical protein [Leifsonia shinshuensis]
MALILSLTGCSTTPDRSGVVGTWVNEGPRAKEAVLVFSGDGTVRACGLPSPLIQSAFADVLDWDRRIGLLGAWTFEGSRVYLDIDRVLLRGLPTAGISGTYLYVSGPSSSPELTVALGDPDEGRRFAFHRTGNRRCDPDDSD